MNDAMPMFLRPGKVYVPLSADQNEIGQYEGDERRRRSED